MKEVRSRRLFIEFLLRIIFALWAIISIENSWSEHTIGDKFILGISYIDNDMMGYIYESEKDDIFVFITLISRFGCDYELKYVRVRKSKRISNIFHFPSLF